MYYIHKDYLGSYYCVTSDNGVVIEYNNTEQIYSFDPWGRRRNHADWSYENVPISSLFDRGFTGHEHLDAFELINMNGRVYDPVLGRMLSPDPFIQSPGNSQNYNRYTYAFNNPLKYVDPSGYETIESYFSRTHNPYLAGIQAGQAHNFNVSCGVNHPGAIQYHYGTGEYVNNYTGERLSWDNVYTNYILPNSNTVTNVFNSSTAFSRLKHSNGSIIMLQSFNNHFFHYDIRTGIFYLPHTSVIVNPYQIIFGERNSAEQGSSEGDDRYAIRFMTQAEKESLLITGTPPLVGPFRVLRGAKIAKWVNSGK
ncbi:MAG: RHS repeat-associated core domain-containing protein, partial [Bacteroidales bacterium]|nr:RHS repeat-associated core domain-containing protein [Bacteroidales bacterium]